MIGRPENLRDRPGVPGQGAAPPSGAVGPSAEVRRHEAPRLRLQHLGEPDRGVVVTRAGVCESVAAARLKQLVEVGALRQRPYREPGARLRQEYVLTPMGRDLLPVVLSLMQWADTHLQPGGGPLRVVERAHRGPGARPAGHRHRGPGGVRRPLDRLERRVGGRPSPARRRFLTGPTDRRTAGPPAVRTPHPAPRTPHPAPRTDGASARPNSRRTGRNSRVLVRLATVGSQTLGAD
ncbi:hypothetical protein GTW78_03715 [Streptomyces sp. SID4948]|nr:winged helix-turn-helix transcriptional regulator [Streptomyces sp. SID4948]MYS19374.1 hypothetical protein [Streptomyces sp. SID4948]